MGPRRLAARAEDLRLRQRLVRTPPRVVRGTAVVHQHARPAPGQPAARRHVSLRVGARRDRRGDNVRRAVRPAVGELRRVHRVRLGAAARRFLRADDLHPQRTLRQGAHLPTRPSWSASATPSGRCSATSSRPPRTGCVARLLQRHQSGRRLAGRMRRLRGAGRRRAPRCVDRADVGWGVAGLVAPALEGMDVPGGEPDDPGGDDRPGQRAARAARARCTTSSRRGTVGSTGTRCTRCPAS